MRAEGRAKPCSPQGIAVCTVRVAVWDDELSTLDDELVRCLELFDCLLIEMCYIQGMLEAWCVVVTLLISVNLLMAQRWKRAIVVPHRTRTNREITIFFYGTCNMHPAWVCEATR